MQPSAPPGDSRPWPMNSKFRVTGIPPIVGAAASGSMPAGTSFTVCANRWLSLLKEDDRAIFTAASKASAAADYLRSFSEKVEEDA